MLHLSKSWQWAPGEIVAVCQLKRSISTILKTVETVPEGHMHTAANPSDKSEDIGVGNQHYSEKNKPTNAAVPYLSPSCTQLCWQISARSNNTAQVLQACTKISETQNPINHIISWQWDPETEATQS